MNTQNQFSLSISSAQFEQATALYNALLAQDLDEIYALVNPKVKDELQKKPESLEAAFTVLAGKEQKEAELMGIERAHDTNWGQMHKASLQFDYSENNILYTVVFAEGENPDIIGFWINQTQN